MNSNVIEWYIPTKHKRRPSWITFETPGKLLEMKRQQSVESAQVSVVHYKFVLGVSRPIGTKS